MRKLIEDRQSQIKSREWNIKCGKLDVNIRKQVERVAKFVQTVSVAGNIISMYEPHSAIVWAGISFALPVSTPHGTFIALLTD